MKLLILIISLGLILAGCKKSQVVLLQADYKQSHGVLTGYNSKACPEPSCGGLMINIQNDTLKNPSKLYLINQTLTHLGISENTMFPINVSLSWKRDTGVFGAFNYIIVSKIQVDK